MDPSAYLVATNFNIALLKNLAKPMAYPNLTADTLRPRFFFLLWWWSLFQWRAVEYIGLQGYSHASSSLKRRRLPSSYHTT